MDTQPANRAILTCTACGTGHTFACDSLSTPTRGRQDCLHCGAPLISWRGQTDFRSFAIVPQTQDSTDSPQAVGATLRAAGKRTLVRNHRRAS
jgi:hypothetical protein